MTAIPAKISDAIAVRMIERALSDEPAVFRSFDEYRRERAARTSVEREAAQAEARAKLKDRALDTYLRGLSPADEERVELEYGYEAGREMIAAFRRWQAAPTFGPYHERLFSGPARDNDDGKVLVLKRRSQ